MTECCPEFCVLRESQLLAHADGQIPNLIIPIRYGEDSGS